MSRKTEIYNVFAKGSYRQIGYARKSDGSYPTKVYLHSLLDDQRKLSTGTRYAGIFQQLCNQKKLLNPNHLKKMSGTKELWEFIVGDHRILAFKNSADWVLAHGFYKDTKRTPKKEIRMGERIRREFFEQLNEGT